MYCYDCFNFQFSEDVQKGEKNKQAEVMSFIEVELSSWDTNKVRIGVAPKGKTPTVLYDGKLPILKLCSNDTKNKYVVFSFNGLQRNMKWDAGSKKFLDVWEGDWSVSFQVAASYAQAKQENGLAWKIVEIFDDIEKKVEQAFKRKPNRALNVTIIKEKNEFGVEEEKGIDETKGVYIKGKVGYDAPKDAKKFIKDGKEIPVLESRVPKAKFYDITKAKDDMFIKNPDIECQTAMNAVPKMMIGLFANTQGVYVTKRLMQCYYEPTTVGGDAPDDELIEMLRQNLDLDGN